MDSFKANKIIMDFNKTSGTITCRTKKMGLSAYKLRKPVLPEYPPIQIYYFSPCIYITGQMTVDVEGYPVEVYDKEKHYGT